MIELLAVTAIIALVTGVVLANNNRFGGVVLLENLAYDVALSIRQAQVYGISVARFQTSTFSAGYGVNLNSSNPTSYALFADSSGNGLYDCVTPGGPGCELIQASSISLGYKISKLCAPQGVDSVTCQPVNQLDVLFKRPEPDAWISVNGNSCTLNTANCQSSARIVVSSPRGDTMSIIVAANGQIAVSKGN